MKIGILLLAPLLLSGCSQSQLLKFSILSTRSVDPAQFHRLELRGGPVEGRDTLRLVVIVPIGSASIQTAVDAAIASTPGCVALQDGSVSLESAGVPFLYYQQSVIVAGHPLIDPQIPTGTATRTAAPPTPLPTR